MVVQWIVKAATLPRQSNGGSRAIVCPTVHAAWNVLSRGTSPSRVDWLTSSVTWVEQGKLPTNVIASETAADSAVVLAIQPREQWKQCKIVKTRPIFPYPMQARYNREALTMPQTLWVMPSLASDDRVNWIGNDLFQPMIPGWRCPVERLIFT